YRICDITGFRCLASRTRKQWNGLIVRNESFEARHPQDFVKGVADQQAVPEPRPRPAERFIQLKIINTESGLNGGIGYGPPLEQEGGGYFYIENPPTALEIAPVDPSKYPKSA